MTHSGPITSQAFDAYFTRLKLWQARASKRLTLADLRACTYMYGSRSHHITQAPLNSQENANTSIIQNYSVLTLKCQSYCHLNHTKKKKSSTEIGGFPTNELARKSNHFTTASIS